MHLCAKIAPLILLASLSARVARADETNDPSPLSLRTGEITWTPGVDVRARSETRVNPYVLGPDAGGANHFVATRARVELGAEWRAGKAFVQFQDARNFGTPPGADDGETFAVHQGYGEVAGERGYIRLGRQEINLGDQRMIGALDWLMNARSFDALRLHGSFGRFELDGAVAMLRPKSQLSSGESVSGDYLTTFTFTTRLSEAFAMDLYLLYRHDGGIEGNVSRDRDIAAPGARIFGKIGAFGYTLEGTAQTGDDGGDRHLAYALSGDARYGFEGPHGPQVHAGFSVASGASPDGRLREFENFFPTNHKFYGFADLFGLRNLLEGHVGALARPTSSLTVAAVFHVLGLYHPHARWSDAGGNTLGSNAVGSSRFLGGELDLTASVRLFEGLDASIGYSVFTPGVGARRLDNDETQHWAYLMFVAKTP